jgi:hypothetical protein
MARVTIVDDDLVVVIEGMDNTPASTGSGLPRNGNHTTTAPYARSTTFPP